MAAAVVRPARFQEILQAKQRHDTCRPLLRRTAPALLRFLVHDGLSSVRDWDSLPPTTTFRDWVCVNAWLSPTGSWRRAGKNKSARAPCLGIAPCRRRQANYQLQHYILVISIVRGPEAGMLAVSCAVRWQIGEAASGGAIQPVRASVPLALHPCLQPN